MMALLIFFNVIIFFNVGGIALIDEGRPELEFTAIRINGSAHLAFTGNDTVVNVGNIYGDDTGYIHIGPSQVLNITDVSR